MRPEQLLERHSRFPQRDGRLRVRDRRLDLPAVPHDPGVGEQAPNVSSAEAGHRIGIEPGERSAKSLALAEDRQP
jgi:hypothetical protein